VDELATESPESDGWTVIRPNAVWRVLDWQEIAHYRELLFFLVWKDIKVRYKQTILGVGWVLFQPLLALAIFSLIFGRLAKMPSDGVPYPVYAYAGLLPWMYFVRALTTAPTSLTTNPDLIRKVYFPRYLVPVSTLLSGVIDFGIGLLAFAVLMPAYGVGLSAQAVFLPAFFALAFVASVGISLWLSALNVRFRDVRALLPFLAQVWLYASPVVYPASLIPEAWRPVYALNPMVGVIEGFRWALLGTEIPIASSVAVSTVSGLLLLATGMHFFRRGERVFADVI
jgi:lipopolysaccharide transport system permease protein